MSNNQNYATLKNSLHKTLHSRKEFVKIYRPFVWARLKFADYLVVDFGSEKYRVKKQRNVWEIFSDIRTLSSIESIILDSEKSVSNFFKERLNNVCLTYIENEAQKGSQSIKAIQN